MSTFLGNNAQYIRFPFDKFIEDMKAFNVKNVDLSLMTPHYYVDSNEAKDIANVKAKLKQADIKVKCVTPPPYRYSICAEEGFIQQKKTLEYYSRCIDVAEYLETDYINITLSGACFDYKKERLIESACANLKSMVEFAEKHNKTFLIGTVLSEADSPINATTPVGISIEDISEIVNSVNSRHLSVYLDVATVSLCGETIEQWFKNFGEKISLIRFSDGNYNGFRALGDGCLPCRKIYNEILNYGYKGDFSLQTQGEKYIDDPKNLFFKDFSYIKENL